MEPPVDKRALLALIKRVAEVRRFVVEINDVIYKLKETTKNDGEAYRLGAELYTALSEGKVKNAYLIGKNNARIVVSPTELTPDQARVLNELTRLYGIKWTEFCDSPSDFLLDLLINALIQSWTGKEEVAYAVYMFAKNNNLRVNEYYEEAVMKGILKPGFLSLKRFVIEDEVELIRGRDYMAR
jgi:hypothetical protein